MEWKAMESEIVERCEHILSCALSLQFITKDLAEMETIVSQKTDGYYSGITNIIEHMVSAIKEEVKDIMELL